MPQPYDPLLQHLHALPVSSGALRLLVALIAEGALEREAEISNLQLGRSCFSHEPDALLNQALRKQVGRFVEELEKARVLQVTTVKVDKGHDPSRYRVILNPEVDTTRQQFQKAPKNSPENQKPFHVSPTATASAGRLIVRPKQKRVAPPHLLPPKPQGD